MHLHYLCHSSSQCGIHITLMSFLIVSMQMTQHNVGALVVVKPGEQKSIAGIITERGIYIFVLFV